jgi:Tol biopolymer transport system component
VKISEPARSSAAFDWLMGILCFVLIAGVVQDGWAHNHGKVDESFFTPWHAMLYGAMALNGIVLGIVGLRNLSKGFTFRNGLPFGYWLSLIGVFLFALGGGLDLLWHSMFGIEQDINALVSPTHLTLAFAAALVCSGPIRSVAHRVGVDEGGWRNVGPVVLAVTATLMLVGFFTQYVQPIADDSIASVIAKADNAPVVGGLYSMNADGSDQRRLFSSSSYDIYAPSVSRDGRYVSYRSAIARPDSIDSASDIYVARIDGTHPHRITRSGRHDTQPAWSADGKRIAYVSEPAGTSGDFELRTVKPDGSVSTLLLGGVTTLALPTWSPDGTRIAIGSRSGTTDEIEIVSAISGGSQPEWLGSTANGTSPAWSPDGTQIAFVAEDPTGGNDTLIEVTDPKGSPARVVSIRGAFDPAWSHDGKHLAYVATVRGTAQVFVSDAGGKNFTDVSQLSGMDAARPVWTKNGKVLFVGTGRGQSTQSGYGRALSLAGMLIQAIVVVGAFLLIVRRWRAPLGTITVVIGLFALAMATQNDDYFAVPAAIGAGIVGDVLLAWRGQRARSGAAFYALGVVVPVLLTALYLAFLDQQRGLGWPSNMIFGSPIIAGFAGLMVAFAYDPPFARQELP